VRKKKLARLASGFVFLLTNPEFFSHLASWRVVIRTPENIDTVRPKPKVSLFQRYLNFLEG
jgi:hypothetical protein